MKKAISCMSLLMAVLIVALAAVSCGPQIVINTNIDSTGASVSGSVEQANTPAPAATEAPAPTVAPAALIKPELTVGYIDCSVCDGSGYTLCGMCQGTGVLVTTSYTLGPPPSYTPIEVKDEQICPGYGCNGGHVECVSCKGAGYFEQYYTPDGKEVDPGIFERAWTRYLQYVDQGYTDTDFNIVYDTIVYEDLSLMYGDIDVFTPSVSGNGTGMTCRTCGGSGKVTCSSCHGSKSLTKTKYAPDYTGSGNNSYDVSVHCPACNGTGKTFCSSCMGKGHY